MSAREPGSVWGQKHALSVLMATGLFATSACSWAAEREAWDALVEEAHKLLTNPDVRAGFQRRHRAEALDATCAILRYPRSPEESLREARALSEPFFASLALGGIAALTIKSDPARSEELLEEAQQVALKINHWTDKDATSLGYLIQLVRHYGPERARRLLVSFRRATDSRGESSKGQAIHQLALATIEVDPGAVKDLLTDSALKSGHNFRAIEVLVRFLIKQSPDDTLKLAQEHYDTSRNWPTCATFLGLVLAEHAVRDPKDAFERARKTRPNDRESTCNAIAAALLGASKKEQAKPMADLLEALDKSGELKGWYAQDRLRKVREAMEKGIEEEPEPEAATPEQIQAFLDAPSIRGLADILDSPEIRFRDAKQARDFVAAALPLAPECRFVGESLLYPRPSMTFGGIAVVAAIAQGPADATKCIEGIKEPQLRAFYLLAAYEVVHPLPVPVRDWPLRFLRTPLIHVPVAKEGGAAQGPAKRR